MLSVYDQYTDIQIADIKTGLVIFSRDEAGIGADISEEEAIKNAGLAGVGEQIYFKKDQGKVALHILHPIAASTRAGEVGRPSLAAIFMVNPERLLKQLLHGDTGLGQSEEVVLVDMDRTILSPLKCPLPGNKKATPLEYRVDAKHAELAVLGIDGVVFGADYTGAPVIAAVRHLRLTAEFGFGMIVKINEEEIFAIARQGLKQALVISGLGFFLVLSLVYVFSRRITQPLIRLRGTAEQVMAGDLGARAAVTTRDEVGYLAASFNSMVSEIQKGQEELETRVRERTAALDLELTARRQAEEELQKYRNRLEDLVQERTVELVEAQEALVSIVEDLNEKTVQLAEAMDQAQSADRLKSAFLANMSHELRTPLNSIIGFTGIVLQGMSGPLNDEQAKQLTMVKGSANHLLALINDVLDISKIEAGQVEIRRRSFDMRSIVETVMATLMPLAAKKGLSLESAIAADVGAIISDRRRVEQILLNLVNNAVKFTEEGVVRIVARIVRGAAFGARSQEPSSVIPAEAGIQEPVEKSEGGVVSELHGNFPEISVADTGIGIKPEDMDKLFLPFSQIDAGLARRHEGTGLGLSICRRLAEMLGGTMRVEGEWGRGSVFTFTLPV